MNVPKSVFDQWLIGKKPTLSPALFEREVREIFEEFRQYCKGLYVPPTGMTIKLFSQWLKKGDIVLVSRKRKVK